VLLGNGDGTFQAAAIYGSGDTANVAQISSVAVADVNGDGRPDLLLTTESMGANGNNGGAVSVLLGNGDGTFQVAVEHASGGFQTLGVAVGDVNGDGRPDVLLANICSQNNFDCGGPVSTVTVLLNSTPFCTTPPVITLSATPTSLWPPNGKMVPATVSGTITDTGCIVTSAAYAVTDEYGQIQPSGPVTLSAGGGYSFTVLLRASRLGTDLDGRRYTVTIRASDNAGNSGSKTSVITVPHDQGH
jgi:hypothetical protein